MGYLFLGIALLCGAIKGYCGKKTSGFLREPTDAVLVTLLRMSICILIGIAMVSFDKTASFAMSPTALAISLAAGVTSSVFVISWILAVRSGSYMMVDIFLTAGVVIPIAFCAILYGEKISLQQIIGCGLLFVAVLIMCSYNSSIKKKITVSSLILTILASIGNGCTDLLQKVYVHTTENGAASVFNFYTYVSATVTLSIVYAGIMIFGKKKNGDGPEEKKNLKLGKIFPYIFMMAICLFFNSFFKTLAAGYLDSVILYPISQVGTMLLASVVAVVFFKEKMNKKGVLGIVVALCAMLLINL